MSLSVSRQWFRTALLVASAPLLTVACEDDFDSRSQLSGYRVLGIQTTPPEVGPDDALEIQVHEYQQGEEATVHTWSLCLYSQGALTEYECDEAQGAEVELPSMGVFVLDLGPEGLGLRERLEALGERVESDGSLRSLSEGFDIWLKLRSGPDCEGCDRIDSVKRLHIREANEPANRNPGVEAFSIEGERTPGSLLTLAVQTDAPETYDDRVTGEAREEEYLYTWYTTKGETDPGLTFGEEQQTEWTIPIDAESGETVELFVAIRDGRGGLSVEAQTVTVQ